MADKSAIEWTDATWNPVAGCTKISAGCDNCYAARFAERWRGVKGHPYEHGFDLRLWESRLDQPVKWKRPRMIFVNSMSDLFHKDIPSAFIDKVFDVMERADHHIYQVLTKRSSLMQKYVNKRYAKRTPPEHIWLGVSVESKATVSRIEHLRKSKCHIRFLSIEPLLGAVGKINLAGIGWVIVGGESGPGARPMDESWIIEIRDQCVKAKVPFFFKQWGGKTPKAGGRTLKGRDWSDFPEKHPNYEGAVVVA